MDAAYRVRCPGGNMWHCWLLATDCLSEANCDDGLLAGVPAGTLCNAFCCCTLL